MARIGIDVGGTHTDGVLIDNNTIVKKTKVLTTHNNLQKSIEEVIDELLKNYSTEKIKKITLSTTLTTNLILEKKLPATGLIISGGPGIALENFKKDEFTFIIDGAIDHRGRILKDINLKDIETIIDSLLINDIETVAICTKFSIRNPVHEKVIKERMDTKFDNVTTGHSLSGNLSFPRRINTAYLNAATYKKNKEFLDHLKNFLKNSNINADIFILKADGGTIKIEEALEKPIYTILSGSAAGIIGVMSVLDITEEFAAVIDIGGTSSDFSFFYNGLPLFEPDGIKIGEELTLVRAMYSHSLGIGGDSFVREDSGNIKIGPERKGVAIAFGGEFLTPTDFIFYKNNIDSPYFEKLEKQIVQMADKLKISPMELTEKVLINFSNRLDNFLKNLIDEINNRPIYTIKEFLGYKEFKVKKIYLMGAPAKNFKDVITDYLDYEIEVVPYYDVINAVGTAVSKQTKEITLFADTAVNKLTIPEIDFFTNIDSNFSIDNCHSVLADKFGKEEYEIVEEMIFNIISGFYKIGKTFRIKAQTKPGAEIILKSI